MTEAVRLRAVGWLISAAALAAVVVWALHQPAPEGRRFVFAGAVLACAIVAAAVAALVLHRRGQIARAWAFVRPMLTATSNLRGRHGAEALATTLAIWALEAGVWLCCADAAGLHVSAVDGLYLLALASLFVFVPAGPGNVGT